MVNWRVLESLFTVETMMIPRENFLVWNAKSDVSTVWAKAEKYKVDYLPVEVDGKIESYIAHGSDDPTLITEDWTVPPTLSVREIVHTFAETQKSLLFVQADVSIVGLITPSDLNKLPARTFFYNLIAQLEMQLAEQVKQRNFSDDDVFKLMGKADDIELQQFIQKKLSDSDLNIGVLHTLNLSNLVNIIKNDTHLRESLGFTSKGKVEKCLNGLVDLRNMIMHPVSLILDDKNGITRLAKRTKRLINMLIYLETNSIQKES